MGFQRIPSLFRIPRVETTEEQGFVWRGYGPDEGLFGLACSSWGGCIIVRSPNFWHSLVIDGVRMQPVFSDINGYVYWQGNGYVYYTQSWGWVWCNIFPGYEPIETREYRAGESKVTWLGDSFYVLASPPSGPGRTEEMRPHGSIHDTAEVKTVSAVWPRWVAKKGEFGVYEGKDGEVSDKVLGLPRYFGGGEEFVRSLERDEHGYFTYGRIHHTGMDKWVIGEVGSAGGWHEGAQPKPDGSVTFRFCKPEGSEATGADITVSLRDYICGDETKTAYLGSAAIWR